MCRSTSSTSVALRGAITSRGLSAGFVLGPANTQERWLAEALVRWRQTPTAPSPSAADLRPVLGPRNKRGGRVGPSGPLAPRQGVGTARGAPYLADLGLAGQAWQRHWGQDDGARVLTKADDAQGADAQGAARWVASLRQVVETVFHTLGERFGLTFPQGADLLGPADASGGQDRGLQLGRLCQSPVQPSYLCELRPAWIMCITRLKLGSPGGFLMRNAGDHVCRHQYLSALADERHSRAGRGGTTPYRRAWLCPCHVKHHAGDGLRSYYA